MKKKLTILSLATFLSFSSFFNIYGATSQQLDVFYPDIKIFIDGQQIDLKNTTDKKTEPFISNETTFVPFRLISEALNYVVEWSDYDKSIHVSTYNESIAFGKNGLYDVITSRDSVALRDKISEEPIQWAKKINNDSYLVLTYKSDSNDAIFKIINKKGVSLNTILNVSKFLQNRAIATDSVPVVGFKDGNVEFTASRMVGTQSIEEYTYSVNIESKKITVKGFTPSGRDNLGSFNGDKEKYQAFINDAIAKEQASVDEFK